MVFLVLGYISKEQTNLFPLNMSQKMKNEYLMDWLAISLPNNAKVTMTLVQYYDDQLGVIGKLSGMDMEPQIGMYF